MKVKAPFFVDPIYNGAADPVMIKNEETGGYYIFYTQLRASECHDETKSYCYGSAIGVAEYDAKQESFFYRGTLDLEFEFGQNTFWAPEIIYDKDAKKYHMYVTYIRGIQESMDVNSTIHHYVSADMFKWEHVAELGIGKGKAKYACVHELPSGGWRMWYTDFLKGPYTFYADSKDLNEWKDIGQATSDFTQERPRIFNYDKMCWMISCEGMGEGVYYTFDTTAFMRQGGKRLLLTAGSREKDGAVGRHASVFTLGERAYILYFVNYNDEIGEEATPMAKHAQSVLQIAELSIKDGKLMCRRNEEFDINM